MKVISIILILLFASVCHAQNRVLDLTASKVLDVHNAVEIEWKPDSSKLAILTGETIQIWNAAKWELLHTITDAYANDIEWHPTDDLIAGLNCCDSEKISIWNSKTGELQAVLIRELPTDIQSPAILSTMAWHPNGQSIASDSFFDLITLWDLESLSPKSFTPFDEAKLQNIVEISWSREGKYLLSANVNGTIDLWDGQDGKHMLQVNGYKHIAWDADENRFAGAGFENVIQIWHIDFRTLASEFIGHPNTITSIDWNTSKDLLSSTDADGNLIIWELNTGERIDVKIARDEFIRSAKWSSDGVQIAISTLDSVYIFNWLYP